MDSGRIISYQLLEIGTPVLASDGARVGSVAAVLTADGEGIFHGILLDTDAGLRFAPAEVIGPLQETAVTLRLDRAAAAALGPRERAAPVYRGAPRRRSWQRWVSRLTGRGGWQRRL